jgi:hypothetical protein
MLQPILQVKPEEEGPLYELTSRAQEITLDPNYLNQDNFLRVLRARGLKVDAAFEMWQRWYEWRCTYRADSITDEEMMPHITAGKAFFFGQDRAGRPCLIVRTRYHWPNQFSPENTMRFVIYMMEKAVKLADEKGIGQVCVIYDRGEMTDENRDNNLIQMMRTLSGMLQDFYAERLGAVYVLHINWFYWVMYQMVKPLIQRKTGDKIHVLRNTNGLREFFEPDQLMREYGGVNSFIPEYPKQGR